jgi:UDP-glucose 4-epimerase
MRILVTGVAGLLGSAVAARLLTSGHSVVGIDNLEGGYRTNVPEGVEFHEVDGRNLPAVTLLAKGCDAVFHAACTAYEGLSVFSPSFVTQNTFELTVAVVTAAIRSGVGRFVHCSSMARYGSQDSLPFRESMTPNPQDPYGIAKLASEQVVWNLSNVHGIEATVLVPHNIFGPGQKYDDPYRNVASIMINRILHGKPPVIYGDGSQTRCFSYIDDVVEPIYIALTEVQAVGQTINIGPDHETVTIRKLASIISEKMDYADDPVFVPGRPQEVKHATCSADLSRELLGYETTISLEDGLARLINWISSQPRKSFSYSLPVEIRSALTPKTWVDQLM